MIKRWLENRRERKAMQQLSREVAAQREKRLEYLLLCKYMDADTPQDMIKMAETLRIYVEGE